MLIVGYIADCCGIGLVLLLPLLVFLVFLPFWFGPKPPVPWLCPALLALSLFLLSLSFRLFSVLVINSVILVHSSA